MREALHLFAQDPPDTDFQRGYLEALKTFAIEAMGFNPTIECNLPFPHGRLPVCACDSGEIAPTKLDRMKCKLRGGPCSPNYPTQEAALPAST